VNQPKRHHPVFTALFSNYEQRRAVHPDISHAGGPGFESLRAHHSNLSESVVCGFRSFPLLPSATKNVSEPYQNAFGCSEPLS